LSKSFQLMSQPIINNTCLPVLLIAMNKITLLIYVTIFLPFANISGMLTYAHNFDTDDNSSFLTLVNKLVIENRLLNESMSPISNNKTNSFEYIETTEKMLEDMLDTDDSFTVSSDQFYNNTVIALVVANLADDVLRNYGHTFGVPSFVMLEMNFSNLIDSQSKPNENANTNGHNNHLISQKNASSTASNASADDNTAVAAIMIEKPSYLRTLEITDRVIHLYKTELNGTSSSPVYINKAKADLGNSLYDLKKAIELKEKPLRIMEIVHGKVHPNLQLAFNLTLMR
jgi:hypothetical protein